MRQLKAALDLSFVIPAVRHLYGRSGHVSLDPRVILKMMLLLFYYDSFADAANNHGSKRARWRGLARQQLQSWLICTCQNLRLLVKHRRMRPIPAAGAGTVLETISKLAEKVQRGWKACAVCDRGQRSLPKLFDFLVSRHKGSSPNCAHEF